MAPESAASSAAQAAALCALAFWCSARASRAAFAPAANNASVPPLHDLMHDAFPGLSHTNALTNPWLFCLPDRLALGVFCATIALIGAHGAPKWCCRVSGDIESNYDINFDARSSRGCITILHCLREACLFLAILQFLRAAIVGVTTYPSPVGTCRLHSSGVDFDSVPQPCWIEICCNDLMFSGHTACNVASAMIWSFSRAPIMLKVFWWVFVLAACAVSVVTRDHYSADVVVALVITVLVGLLRRENIEEAFGHSADRRKLILQRKNDEKEAIKFL